VEETNSSNNQISRLVNKTQGYRFITYYDLTRFPLTALSHLLILHFTQRSVFFVHKSTTLKWHIICCQTILTDYKPFRQRLQVVQVILEVLVVPAQYFKATQFITIYVSTKLSLNEKLIKTTHFHQLRKNMIKHTKKAAELTKI